MSEQPGQVDGGGAAGGPPPLDSYAVPVAPPTSPGYIPPAPPQWPGVLGVIAIVFGTLGALSALGSFASYLLLPMFQKLAGNAPGMQAAFGYKNWNLALGVVGLLAGGLLISAGIKLRARSPVAMTQVMWWSVIRMVMAVVQAVVASLAQWNTIQSMNSSQSGAMPPAAVAIQKMLVPLTGAGTLLWGWALPIFMLVWFRRAKIRKEVSSWREQPGAVRA